MYRKKIAALLVLSFALSAAFSQNRPSYEKQWKTIDSLLNKRGLPASASAELDKLYARAKKEGNDVQVIKALIYRMNMTVMKEQDAEQKNILALEHEITAAHQPAKAILENLLASQYWHYFQGHRWQLYRRTATLNYKEEDPATWSINDFHSRISALYLSSIRDKNLLQQTRLEPFDAIIIKGNARHLRPTLYDLLAHNALDYFKNDEPDLNRPAYHFELNQQSAFDPAAFVRQQFATTDSLSLHHKALLLFRELIGLHLHDQHTAALIDVDLERLRFVREYSTLEDKEDRYRSALEHMAIQYESDTNASEAWYQLANWYAEKAETYHAPADTANRFDYVHALALCNKLLSHKSNTEGYADCYNLRNSILRPSLRLQSEEVNVPGQPFRVLVTYRNLSSLFARIVKLDANSKALLSDENGDEKKWNKIVRLAATSSFSVALPDPGDYQQHRAEIKVDALPAGDYALISGVSGDMAVNDSTPLAVQTFAVSDLSYIRRANDYFVLHRETGEPVTDATARIWHATNNQKLRKGEDIRPDKNGHFILSLSKNEKSTAFKIELITTNDHFFPDELVYYQLWHEPSEEKNITATFLFTDRSIYRPGQTVYFKGIMVNRRKKENINSIVPSRRSTVYLYGPRHEKIDSLSVTTNSFGSYAGKFTLPSHTVTGGFVIQDSLSHYPQTFSVEEYKRPAFLVELMKPEHSYKLNDSISVTGSARSYAGSQVNGAKVSYRVVRRTILPFFGFGKYIRPPFSNKETEIAHGTTVTDMNGSFIVPFKLIPDRHLPKKEQPVFDYTISADITDLNGETRSASTMLSASWQALRLHIDVPEKISADSLKSIPIVSTNLEGVFQPSYATLTIGRLKSPDRIFRSRYWEEPDQFTMNQQEYYRLFPYDMYRNETDMTQWEKQQRAFTLTDSVKSGRPFDLGSLRLQPGWYLAEATIKDSSGEEITDRKYIQVYDRQSASGPLATISIEKNSANIQPGASIDYTIKTNLGKLFLVHDIEGADEKFQRRFLDVNDSASFALSLKKQNPGAIILSAIGIRNNRVYEDRQILKVMSPDRDLHISYVSYRNKTLPGSHEKWSVNISGTDGNRVAAEILTSMYDASLDQFSPHRWQPMPLWEPETSRLPSFEAMGFEASDGSAKEAVEEEKSFSKEYDVLGEGFGASGGSAKGYDAFGQAKYAVSNMLMEPVKGVVSKNGVARFSPPRVVSDKGRAMISRPVADTTVAASEAPPLVPTRTNFNETAFFFPDLQTDSMGNVSFSFTMPEALTQWKWMLLAHTRELAFGMGEKTIVTQKQLMVQPNAPRFLREGDRMDFSGKIVNMTDKEITGQVELQFIDPTTHQSVDGWFRNMFPNQYFTAAAHQSVPVSFTIEVPFLYNRPVIYRLIARSDSISDGEENILPVLSNRTLVTETLPLPLKGAGTHHFNFEKLAKSGESETLQHQSLTVEFTSNPAWQAVLALPYLMEYPYECAEQTFNRYYANALAAHITQSIPAIKAVFAKWSAADSSALLSQLQKNQELKNAVLEETPWLLQAQDENEQKKHIATLFDMVRMGDQLAASLQKTQQSQLPEGGFPWFQGGRADRYITQYILAGLGHLQKLNALPEQQLQAVRDITKNALRYADGKLRDDYNSLLRRKINPDSNNIGYTQIQYLYIRSFFNEYPVPGDVFPAYNYYRKQAQRYWLQQSSKYMQGMIALSLFRTGDVQTARNIMASLQQHALVSDEMGMYWKDVTGGYYWHQSPIETQSLLIEAFREITGNSTAVNDMRIWLLKQKQVQQWSTTKATADACYALLLQGSDLLATTPQVQVKLGNLVMASKDQQEAGTGYFKKLIDGKKITPGMANVQVTMNAPEQGSHLAWGAIYWQYFETLEKITPAASPLRLEKKLFIETNTDRGPVLQPVAEGAALHVGDKVRVRIELRADRDLEYVHMKDMRASCLEPVNVLSGYRWQNGLGYYESTRDASTSFFFDRLPRGTYVFEYPLFVTHTGSFSNGITSIQCMYAPEFASHSEGIKISVE